MWLFKMETLMGASGLAGALLCAGCIVYRRGLKVLDGELATVLAAFACGAGIFSAFHLIGCSFAPNLLFDLVDAANTHKAVDRLAPAGTWHVEFAAGHFLEVLAGGLSALGVSVIGLAACCRK